MTSAVGQAVNVAWSGVAVSVTEMSTVVQTTAELVSADVKVLAS